MPSTNTVESSTEYFNVPDIAECLVQDLSDISYEVSGQLASALRNADALDAVEYTRSFVAVRRVKDELDDIVKKFNALYEEMRTVKLPAKFEEAGVPTITLDEGYRVTVSHLVRASIKTDQREGAYQWLRDNGLGDLITPTVNASTLSAAAKSMQEDNQELVPEYFNVSILNQTSVTKVK